MNPTHLRGFATIAPAFTIPAEPDSEAIFGAEIAVDGDRVLISAPTLNSYPGTPRAWLGRLGRDRWERMAAFQPHAGDSFGHTLALDRGTVAIANSGTDDDDGPVDVFEERAGWSRVARLDGDPVSRSTDGYGDALLVSGDDLFIGHSLASLTDKFEQMGAVHHFRRKAFFWKRGWKRVGRLEPGDPGCVGFGAALARRGDTLAVGATKPGAVYLFRPDSRGRWSVRERVDAPPGDHELSFGSCDIDLGADRLVVAAPRMNLSDRRYVGAVYIFHRASAGTWRLEHTLTSPGTEREGIRFGCSIAADDTHLCIGQAGGVAPDDPGCVWIYERSTMFLVARLELPDGHGDDHFPLKVRLSRGRVLASMVGGEREPAVHVFDLTERG